MYRRSFELELIAFAHQELFLRKDVWLTGAYGLSLFVEVHERCFFKPTFTASPRRGDIQSDAGDKGEHRDDAQRNQQNLSHPFPRRTGYWVRNDIAALGMEDCRRSGVCVGLAAVHVRGVHGVRL